jgi:hypothetical protein
VPWAQRSFAAVPTVGGPRSVPTIFADHRRRRLLDDMMIEKAQDTWPEVVGRPNQRRSSHELVAPMRLV